MLEFIIADFLRAVISLIVVVDPLGNIPIFMGITSDLTPKQKRRAFNIAILTGFILLIVFAGAGNWVLKIFNVELYSFKVAGGTLLLFIALELLMKAKFETRGYGRTPEEAGAVPLGVPLLVGPGAITTVIIILESSGFIMALASVVTVAILTWLILRFINPIHKTLGEVGSMVISKIMAILLAAIAVQYILEGIEFWWSRSITHH